MIKLVYENKLKNFTLKFKVVNNYQKNSNFLTKKI